MHNRVPFNIACLALASVVASCATEPRDNNQVLEVRGDLKRTFSYGAVDENACATRDISVALQSSERNENKRTVMGIADLFYCDVAREKKETVSLQQQTAAAILSKPNGDSPVVSTLRLPLNEPQLKKNEIRFEEAGTGYSYARLRFRWKEFSNQPLGERSGGFGGLMTRILADRSKQAVVWANIYAPSNQSQALPVAQKILFVHDEKKDGREFSASLQKEGSVGPWIPVRGISEIVYEIKIGVNTEYDVNFFREMIGIFGSAANIVTAAGSGGALSATGPVLSKVTEDSFIALTEDFLNKIEKNFTSARELRTRTQLRLGDTGSQQIGSVLVFSSRGKPVGTLLVYAEYANSLVAGCCNSVTEGDYPAFPTVPEDDSAILEMQLGPLKVTDTVKPTTPYEFLKNANESDMEDLSTDKFLRACRNINDAIQGDIGLQYYDRAALVWAILQRDSEYFDSRRMSGANKCPTKFIKNLWNVLNLDLSATGIVKIKASSEESKLDIDRLATWYVAFAEEVSNTEIFHDDLKEKLPNDLELVESLRTKALNQANEDAFEALQTLMTAMQFSLFSLSDADKILQTPVPLIGIRGGASQLFGYMDTVRRIYGADACVAEGPADAVDRALLFGSAAEGHDALMNISFSGRESAEQALPFSLGAAPNGATCAAIRGDDEDSVSDDSESARSNADAVEFVYAAVDGEFKNWLNEIEDVSARSAILKNSFLKAATVEYFEVVGRPDAFRDAINGTPACLTACREFGEPGVSVIGEPSPSDIVRIVMNTRFGYIEEVNRRWRALEWLDDLVRRVEVNQIDLAKKDVSYLVSHFATIVRVSSERSGQQFPHLEALLTHARTYTPFDAEDLGVGHQQDPSKVH